MMEFFLICLRSLFFSFLLTVFLGFLYLGIAIVCLGFVKYENRVSVGYFLVNGVFALSVLTGIFLFAYFVRGGT